MSHSLTLGVSSGIFPTASISAQQYGLLRAVGFAAFEIGYEHSAPALEQGPFREELAAVLHRAHPPAISLHAPYRPERDISVLDEERRLLAVERNAETLALASSLGLDLVVLHASEEPIAGHQRSARLERARQSLEELENRARRYQLRLAVEMMPPQWLPAGATEAHQLIAGLDPEVIGFCLDTNHANLTGDLTAIVQALGQRLWHVHISDNDGRVQRHWMPFEGVIDWPKFMAALISIKYCGPIIYELDLAPESSLDQLLHIRDNFDRLIGL